MTQCERGSRDNNKEELFLSVSWLEGCSPCYIKIGGSLQVVHKTPVESVLHVTEFIDKICQN